MAMILPGMAAGLGLQLLGAAAAPLAMAAGGAIAGAGVATALNGVGGGNKRGRGVKRQGLRAPKRAKQSSSSGPVFGPQGRSIRGRGPSYSGMVGRSKGKRGKSKARGRRTKKAKRKRVLNFQQKGAIHNTELNGTVTDPDALYLYVHDHSPYLTYLTVAHALVRKLVEKAFSKSYSSAFEYILSGQTKNLGASLFIIRTISMRYSDQNFITTDLTVDQGSTIDSLAVTFLGDMERVGMGDGYAKTSNTYEITTITLLKQIYDLAGALVVDHIVLAQLNMAEETVHFKVSTVTKMQNRSVGSDGSVVENNVNMTPLECQTYKFSNIPKHKYIINGPVPGTAVASTGGNLFSQVTTTTGHNTIRAASLTAAGGNSNNWKKLQTRSNFNNCKSVGKTLVPPGSMLVFRQSFSKSTSFNKYLAEVMKRNDSATEFVTTTSGGGTMVGFQDLININATYNMTLTWEIERETRALLTSKRKATWERTFAQTTSDDP